MSLVKLTANNGQAIYVNPLNVTDIHEHNGFVKIYFVNGETTSFKGTLDEIAEKLNRLGG